MNFNKFTIKSQEAVQKAQQIVQELGQQEIKNGHKKLFIKNKPFRTDVLNNSSQLREYISKKK